MSVPISESLFQISIDQFHQMVKAGILQDGDRIELLNGYLVQKMSHNPLHAGSLVRLLKLLSLLLPADQFDVRPQVPITLVNSEPEPDIVVAVPDADDYTTKHPHQEDVYLVVEMADSSLRLDQTTKHEVYAEAKIPQYWIVNLQSKVVEVHTLPVGSGDNYKYLNQTIYSRQDSIPVALRDKNWGSIKVADILK